VLHLGDVEPWILCDLQPEELPDVSPARLAKSLQRDAGIGAQSEIDVPGRPGAIEAELDREASLQDGPVLEDLSDPTEEPVEDQELPQAGERRLVAENLCAITPEP
jgi:hypothetical protein